MLAFSLLTLIPFLPGQVHPGGINPSAWEFLARVEARMQRIKTLSATFESTLDSVNARKGRHQTIHERTEISLMRPRFYREQTSMFYREAGSPKLSQFPDWRTEAGDGVTEWQIINHHLTSWPAPAKGFPGAVKFVDLLSGFDDPEESLISRLKFLKSESALKSVRFAGTHMWQGAKCQVVEIESSFLGETKREQYFVGPDLLLRRHIIDGQEKGRRKHWDSQLSHIRIDAPISLASFKFQPPPSVQPAVDSTEGHLSGSLRAGSLAPDFKMEDRWGHDISLSDYRGKVVVLDFWATWCGNCIEGFSAVNSIGARYSNRNVVVLALNVADTNSVFQTWLRKNPQYADVQFAFDPLGTLSQGASVAYKAGLPMTYVIDRSGRIADSFSGRDLRTDAEIEQAVLKAVASN